MESTTLSEPASSADVATSSSVQNDDTSRTTEESEPHDTIADTKHGSVKQVPEEQAIFNDENTVAAQEASDSSTAELEGTASTPEADETEVQPVLWCRVELNDPQKWAKCAIFDNPRCRQGGRPSSVPRNDVVQPPSPKTSVIKYSNRFVDLHNRLVIAHPWPEALNLDLERGKQAGWKAQHQKAIIELVTIVRTNIDVTSPRFDRYHDTRKILSDPRITAELFRREVIIDSVLIVEAFKTMITYYPGLELRGITMTIPEPYCVFYDYYQEIKALQRTLDASTKHPVDNSQPQTTQPEPEMNTKEQSGHLKVLCDFIESQNLEDVELERKRHRQSPPVATYRMMWLLFKPGTRVYHFSGGRAIAGVVISVQTDNLSQRPGLRSVKFWTLDFDGFKLGRRELSHNFRPFDREKKISELAVCPCDIYDAHDTNHLRDQLIDRGEKFWKFLSGVQIYYEGNLPNEAIEWVSLFIDATSIHRRTTIFMIFTIIFPSEDV